MIPPSPASLPGSTPARRSSRHGFTLSEVMIAASIGAMVLAGALSSFLMIGRSSMRLYYYNGMEAESRRTLEEFAQDVRMGSNSVYNSASSLTLTVPSNYTANSNMVTYAFGDAVVNGTTYANCFFRRPGNTTSTATPTVLIQNVTDCTFTRYDVLGAATSLDSATKRIELTLRVSNTRSTLVAATDNIVSATYLLRNK
ncbi:MAG: prepilin-type N-terminal cleavage/methylation domain-containing protein [Opitutae bacterium]